MRAVKGSIIIGRPVEEVFDFVADERNEPRYNRRMRSAELVSGGPAGPGGMVGRGSRFRAEMARPGRPIELVTELTAYERPRLLASSSHAKALDTRGALTFEPVPEGTRMSWRWELEAHGPWSVAGPLVVALGQAQERRIWEALKQLLEEGSAAAPAFATTGRTEEGRRLGLSLAAGAVAASAYAGALRFAAGRNDPRLAALRRELPWQSPTLAASALTVVVAVPFSVLCALAWRGDRRADRAASGAGGLLLGWLLSQRVLVRETSWLQPLYGGIALCFVVAGDPRRRVQGWVTRRRRPAGTAAGPGPGAGERPEEGADAGRR